MSFKVDVILITFITLSHCDLSAWESGSLQLPGAPPDFLASFSGSSLSTSFTWEWAPVWRKSTQWHFPQCHIYRPPRRARGTISQSDTVRAPGPRWQSSIVVQEEDRGNNNQSRGLSDFSSCLLLLFSTQSRLNTSTSSLWTPTRELLERECGRWGEMVRERGEK